ncbi:unnamed protein product [Paramecium sonneborni]|uniref:Uncharacterized protein n=1 Tax=Paramecium sonneborni TaxID=65129 RepID=A0A8S1PFA1_9CILI|nr:unnamed protein product [Paramecium sonneborni]
MNTQFLNPKNNSWKDTDYLTNDYQNGAYFINCESSTKNYITLDKVTKQVSNCDYESKFYCSYKCLISFDLYFQGTWSNKELIFKLYNESYNLQFTPSGNSLQNQEFCENAEYEIQQINITKTKNSTLNFTFSIDVQGDEKVSLRNIYLLNYQLNCHPRCKECSGPGYNQCQKCYYGNPENQICPPCPDGYYYVKYIGCQSKCNPFKQQCLNEFCQLCSSSLLYSTNFSNYHEWIFWSIIYDDNQEKPSMFWLNKLNYGIFKKNSGLSRFINKIEPKNGHYIQIKISLNIFNDLPVDCGINFQFNETYYGSIYNQSSNIQLDNFTSINCTKHEISYQPYQRYQFCDIIGWFDIPHYPFLFTAIGNLSNNDNVGWAIIGIKVTSHYCTDHCEECDVYYKCKKCQSPYLLYRDGTCIQKCDNLYQYNNGTYCKDFDDETRYSELMIRENINYTYEYNSQYNLISSNGTNFLKGINIHYSFWNGFLIFGGSYIWAQAKFERFIEISRPHHSISIAFYILYGSKFPEQSQFIYTIDQVSFIKKRNQANKQNHDGTFTDIIIEKIQHTKNNLNITFECQGDNEPIKAFCGLYNFYLAVHYCQPNCQNCTDENICTVWNQTDLANYNYCSQTNCLTNQYYDFEQSLCKNCTSSCETCKTQSSCSTCKPTYTLTNLGCFCVKNQYEESEECKVCPPECKQCLSNSYCFECFDSINMKLISGVCECISGNFKSTNKLCESEVQDLCDSNCRKCKQGNCQECDEYWYYDPIEKKCKEKCGDSKQLSSEKCETSSILPYRGCLNCQPRCQSSCKLCSTDGIGCQKCNSGYSLIDKQCYSNCGDQIITDDEQCDDGNLIYGDGCHFCQYSCEDSCQDCINGICFNYILNHPLTQLQCNPSLGNEIENNSQLCNLIGSLYLFSEIYNPDFACDINCQDCFFKTCYICNHNYLLSINSQQCIQITSIFDNTLQHCLIKVDNFCQKCQDYAYFDISEQKCKTTFNMNQCQIYILLQANEFCNQCFQNCMKCSQNSCIKCNQGYYVDQDFQCQPECGDGILTSDEQCEMNDQNCLGCEYQRFQYCQYQHQELCLQCQKGFYYNFITKLCESICGDGLKAEDEDCEIVPIVEINKCRQCKYFCGDGCKSCNNGVCESCNSEYILVNNLCLILNINQGYLNQNLFQESNEELISHCLPNQGYYIPLAFNQCIPICGDGIININEECDDISQVCFNCRFQCPLNCLKCSFGQCLQCIEGFQLSNNECKTICGNQIIKYEKICDDKNDIQFDGCYKCQNNCQIECLLCHNTTCLQCIKGWNLREGKCYQICGDGQLAILSIEECDDLQDLNCRNCKLYKCNLFCKLCDNQQQCKICLDGFELINNNCISVCGDGIIINGFEECDDGNDIQFDGCYNCKYSCTQGCLDCQKNNVCLKCQEEEFFTLNNKTQQCYSYYNEEDLDNEYIDDQEFPNQNNVQIININDIQDEDTQTNQSDVLESKYNCGNGKLEYYFNEECDDGNIIGGDGCSNICKNEFSFQCKGYECSFIKPPDFKLKLLTNTQSSNSNQIIELTFLQEVKLNQTQRIEDIANFTIQPDIPYNLTIIPIIILSTELQRSHYQFSIQFQQSVTDPKFTITFKYFTITNSYNITLSKHQSSIQVGNPIVLSQSTKKKVSQIIWMNDAIIYIMICISVISILLGNPIMLLNQLELLQSFSYIIYVQYQFPPHFQQFLELYSKISLKLILDYLQIDQLLAYLNGGEFPYSDNTTSQNNNSQQFNQLFLVNAKGCYISVLISYCTYLIYQLITSKYTDNFLKQIILSNQENIRLLRLMRLFQKKIQQKCLKLKHEYFTKDIFQVYLTILHQLLFSIFIQFPNYSFQSFFEVINSINSLFALGLIMFVSFKSLSITSQKIKNKTKWKFFFEQSKSQFWAANFKTFQIYRVTSYIFVIVFLMNEPQIQSIFLSIQSLTYLIYLCREQPLKQKSESIKLLNKEFLFFLTVSTFLIYSFDLTEDQLLKCGWIHISMFTIILGTCLLVDMYELISKVYSNYLKNKLKREQQLPSNINSSPLFFPSQKVENLEKEISADQLNLNDSNK